MQTKNTQEELCSFNKLYTEYYTRFVRFANSYVRDQAAAEDITVEAMMYYWENKHELSDFSNIPAYILTIIKNKCLNYLHHLQIHNEYSEKAKEFYEWELNSRISSLQACEPNKLFSNEIQAIVEKTLNEMSSRTRTIFELHRYEAKSYKEIAEIMNISVKGVDFHMRKALKLLQEYLKDYFTLFIIFYT